MVTPLVKAAMSELGSFQSSELTPQGRVNNKCNKSDSKMIIMVHIIKLKYIMNETHAQIFRAMKTMKAGCHGEETYLYKLK